MTSPQPDPSPLRGRVVLEDGATFSGFSFGHPAGVAGEVVFNTGLVGYPETLTDPSYRGQILALTYPLIGNYGVPAPFPSPQGLEQNFEADHIQIRALLVSEYSPDYSHWNADQSLADWLKSEEIPGLTGIDTRSLTQKLREQGTMLGKIVVDGGDEPSPFDPNKENLIAEASPKEPRNYGHGTKKVILVDCGAKFGIIHSLLDRDLQVRRVPWDYDFTGEDYDGVILSNGPGDPTRGEKTIEILQKAMDVGRPIFGVCMGHQLLSLAAGAKTYKLKYGHRSQNQPVLEVGTDRCYVTSQNHGYAVDSDTLPEGWKTWFTNLNDDTNEGIRHTTQPFSSVQFHPEANPGPVDTSYLFDDFARSLAQ